jgi:hypothetical protein
LFGAHKNFLTTIFVTSFFRFLLLMSVMLLIAIPIVLFESHQPGQLHSLSQIISQHYWIFTGIRWSLLVLFIGYWPHLINVLATRQKWNQEKSKFWQQQRFRIGTWLVLADIVLCEIPWLLSKGI